MYMESALYSYIIIIIVIIIIIIVVVDDLLVQTWNNWFLSKFVLLVNILTLRHVVSVIRLSDISEL